MLNYLKLQNVGPAAEMELELGSRLNIMTGDNGLGKSFLLDVAWFVQTGCWPAEVNSGIIAGKIAIPSEKAGGGLFFFPGPRGGRIDLTFDYHYRRWVVNPRSQRLRPTSSVNVYLMTDGSVAVFDPRRNEILAEDALKEREKPKSFVFSPQQIWNGLQSSDGKVLCNGLIRDWATWQNKGGATFDFLQHVLKILSPSEIEPLTPGELTRVSLDDVRDIPTIKMPYEGEVPVIHAASGIRRILSLAYLMVWAWEEHKQAAKLTRSETTKNICVLIDEIDAHLHPTWQRRIIPSILALKSVLPEDVNLQIITSTHSPLIMASLEPLFDKETDAWFDLDLEGNNGKREVVLRKRDFHIIGDASDWLTSEAFDQKESGSLERERILDKAEAAIESGNLNPQDAELLHKELAKVLPADDDFFTRWRIVGRKEGWWK